MSHKAHKKWQNSSTLRETLFIQRGMWDINCFPILELLKLSRFRESRGDNSWRLKITPPMARKQLNVVIRLARLRIRCNKGTLTLADRQRRSSCLCECVYLHMCVGTRELFFCKAAAVRFVVSDVRGQITTHRAGAAGCSIFAIAQWRLERNYLPTRRFPLPLSRNKCCKHQTTGLWGVYIQYQMYITVFLVSIH